MTVPFSLSTELWAATCAALFGILLGVSYDAVRVLRIFLGLPAQRALPARLLALRFRYIRMDRAGERVGNRAHAAVLFVTDLLFAAGAGIAFTIFLYAYHDGAFRLFLLLSAALGFAAYLLTLGRLVYRVAGVIAFFLRVFLAYLFLCLRVPLLLLLRAIFFSLRFLLVLLLRMLVALLSPLFNRIALARGLSATRGFLRAPLG